VGTTPAYTIQINIDQKQKQDAVVGLFKMPIDIDVLYYDGSSEKRTVWVDQAHHTFTWNSFKAPATVVFDAGSHVLKSVETQKSSAEWLWQLSHANNMLDRYDALVALRSDLTPNSSGLPDAEKINAKASALRQAWEKETFREIKVEIASQWCSLLNKSTNSSLLSGDMAMYSKFANSVHAPVRRVLYDRLPLQPTFRELFLQGLKDSSYNNVEFVVDRLWNSTPLSNDQTAVGISRAEILEAIKGEQGHLHNLKIKYLECAYQHAQQKSANGESKSAENDPQMYINLLRDMAGPYYEFRTRTQAMSALKRLNHLDSELAHNLFDAVLNFNTRLSQPATELINHFKQNSQYKQLLMTALLSNSQGHNWVKSYTPADQARLLRVIK
jgi:hypothetical protein